jgi:hypothetical protein
MGFGDKPQDTFEGMGYRHIDMRHRFEFPCSRLRLQKVCIFVQFSKQFCRHLVRKKRLEDTGWIMDRNWSARGCFRRKGYELPTVLSDQGMKEILGFNVRSAAISRRPEGHENEPPRPVRIPFEHGSIMPARRRLGNSHRLT